MILSIGQVVPHEVIGMANYNKNIFVGTSGAEASNKSHYIGAVYGITDEWHQMYVPGRMPDVVDWLADVAGLVTGYAIAATFLNRSNAHESEEPVR